MVKIIPYIFISVVFSCSDIPSQTNRNILSQVERCINDGASIYLQCKDGREKIIGLGYGTFMLMEEGETSEALKFCAEQPVELSINVKNAHINHKELKANGVIILHKKSAVSDCIETKKIKDLTIEGLKDFQKIRVEVTRIPAQQN